MKNELPTKRRIVEIGRDKLNFEYEDLKKIHHAFEKLRILEKIPVPAMMDKGEIVFNHDKEIFQERMNWINEFMDSKGYKEKIFTDIDNYRTSSDDYDYYYELKTPTQLKEEEEARKQKKIDKVQNNGSRV